MSRHTLRTESLRRKLAEAQFAVARFAKRMVRDPGGGLILIETALLEMTRIREEIAQDRVNGSRQHDKIGRFPKFLAWSLPVLDAGILFWFLTGVLNVDFEQLDYRILVAAALALLATAAIAAWNVTLGERLQVAKNDARSLVWEAVDTTERIMLTISVIMALLVGAMMFVRIEDEVYQATGVVGGTSIVIALTLAAAIVVLNLYMLNLAFADGSNVTRRADRLARRVRPHVRRYERDQARVHRLMAALRDFDDLPPGTQLALPH